MSPRKLWHRTSNTSFGPKSLKPFRRCISNHQSQRLSRTPPSLLGLRNSVCRMLNLPRHPMSCLQPQLRRRIPTRDLQLHFTVAQTLGGRQIIGPSVSPVVSLDTSPATVAEIPLQSTPWAGQWRRRLGRHQGTPLTVLDPTQTIGHHRPDDAPCHLCVADLLRKRETDRCSSGGNSCIQFELLKASIFLAAKRY